MGSVTFLPSTHLKSFETIWSNFKKRQRIIAEIELMTSEAYKNDGPIESKQDIGKLGSFSNVAVTTQISIN